MAMTRLFHVSLELASRGQHGDGILYCCWSHSRDLALLLYAVVVDLRLFDGGLKTAENNGQSVSIDGLQIQVIDDKATVHHPDKRRLNSKNFY